MGRKCPKRKERIVFQSHHFSGAMLNFGGVHRRKPRKISPWKNSMVGRWFIVLFSNGPYFGGCRLKQRIPLSVTKSFNRKSGCLNKNWFRDGGKKSWLIFERYEMLAWNRFWFMILCVCFFCRYVNPYWCLMWCTGTFAKVTIKTVWVDMMIWCDQLHQCVVGWIEFINRIFYSYKVGFY